MKKIMLSVAMLLCLCACEKQSPTIRQVDKIDNVPITDVYEFEYKNHEYIMFYNYVNYNSAAGIVHNPECKYCKKTK